MRELRAGIAQLRPAVLDAEGTVDRVVAAIERAAKDGVTLLAFPETFVPVYPLWCDAGAFGQWEHDPAKTAHAALIDASLEVPSPLLDRVVRAAGDHRCSVVLGLNERVGRTLYNAFVVVDREEMREAKFSQSNKDRSKHKPLKASSFFERWATSVCMDNMNI